MVVISVVLKKKERKKNKPKPNEKSISVTHMAKELLILKNPQLTDFNVHFGRRNCRSGVHSGKGL